jgi:hemoglobin
MPSSRRSRRRSPRAESPRHLYPSSKRWARRIVRLDLVTRVHDGGEPSLYVRIGGAGAVAAAVDGLYERIVADPDLTPYFEGVDMDRLKAHQRAFIASALGGPDGYQGRRLDDAHRRLDITPAAFGRVADHLVDTLVALQVEPPVVAAVAEAVGSLRPQVVTHH